MAVALCFSLGREVNTGALILLFGALFARPGPIVGLGDSIAEG
jgi:hypothetical protein